MARFRSLTISSLYCFLLLASTSLEAATSIYNLRVLSSATAAARIPNYYLSDTVAELNALASTQKGDLGFAKDTNFYYSFNGTAWIPLNAQGSTTQVQYNNAGVLAGDPTLSVTADGITYFVDNGTKPTCGASYRGAFFYDAGAAGVADTVEVCTKDVANVYAWRWIDSGLTASAKVYSIPDNSAVNLFTVALPTQDTGCDARILFHYFLTDGTDSVAHSGSVVWAFTNDDGTVNGDGLDYDENFFGTGCGVGCDTYTVTVASTTATAVATFNNTLSATGSLSWTLVGTNCAALTRQ